MFGNQGSLFPHAAFPLEISACDGILHALDAAVQVFEFAFQALQGAGPGAGIGVIEFPILGSSKRHEWSDLHDHGGNEVQKTHRPDSGDEKQEQDRRAHHVHGKVKIARKSGANAEQHAISVPVQTSLFFHGSA